MGVSRDFHLSPSSFLAGEPAGRQGLPANQHPSMSLPRSCHQGNNSVKGEILVIAPWPLAPS